MHNHWHIKMRRVIFNNEDNALAFTGVRNKSMRRMIKQHREGEIKILKISTMRLGDIVKWEEYKEAA